MENHAWFGHHTQRTLELAVSRSVRMLKKIGKGYVRREVMRAEQGQGPGRGSCGERGLVQ